MGFWDYGYYTPAKPKKVKDGIKLESSKIGATWWSQKWISILESFGWSNRLERGRRYARNGQVMNFTIKPGVITAEVQGTEFEPYDVTINVKPFTDKQWMTIMEELNAQALYAAKLISGEMPRDIEEVFSNAKVSLFPVSKKDLHTSCSCPDSANPCKHIAAVYYVLGEEFDRDPFMIFHLRGRSRSQVLEDLHHLRKNVSIKEEKPASPKTKQRSAHLKKVSSLEKEVSCKISETWNLEDFVENFWDIGERFQTFSILIQPPHVPIALLRRLGPPAFWRNCSLDFYVEMERLYAKVQKDALKEAFDVGSSEKTR
jgi:uncharacterized Zn finger protein